MPDTHEDHHRKAMKALDDLASELPPPGYQEYLRFKGQLETEQIAPEEMETKLEDFYFMWIDGLSWALECGD